MKMAFLITRQLSHRCGKKRAALVIAPLALLIYYYAHRGTNPGCGSTGVAETELAHLPKENAERLRRIRNTCRLAGDGFVDRVTSHPRTRVAYCVVPKSSCTFWLSMFWFLSRNLGPKPFAHPLKVPRLRIHTAEVLKFEHIQSGKSLPCHLNDHFRFMFVRDPYTRLWSSYVDKLFLLDFWPKEGKRVSSFFSTAKGREMLGVEKNFSRCGSDISFAEFVAYVVGSRQDAPHELNEHWRPVEYICNPCQFCPHVVGHVETFARDSLPVLERLNMTWVLADHDHALQQMTLLLEENFRHLITKKRFYASCANTSDVSRRLWTAFQMYGYMPESEQFPASELGKRITVERFKAVLFETYKAIPEGVRKTLPQQRTRAMEKAFATVPLRLLEALASLYLYEFVTFGYEMRPRSLFENRYLREGK